MTLNNIKKILSAECHNSGHMKSVILLSVLRLCSYAECPGAESHYVVITLSVDLSCVVMPNVAAPRPFCGHSQVIASLVSMS
jgi:hypothetical protein